MTERRFILRNDFVRQNVVAFLSKMPLEPVVEVLVQRFHEKRSLTANARLWALHTKAGEYTGYSAEEMHELALCRHFGYDERERTDPLTGEIEIARTPKRRSSSLNRKEFGVFMEATEAWYISEFGVYLEQVA